MKWSAVTNSSAMRSIVLLEKVARIQLVLWSVYRTVDGESLLIKSSSVPILVRVLFRWEMKPHTAFAETIFTAVSVSI